MITRLYISRAQGGRRRLLGLGKSTCLCPDMALCFLVTAAVVTLQNELERTEIAQLQLEGIEILELVGRGGMSTVYKARQMNLDRIVAVKILNGFVLEGESQSMRFQNEAKLTANLDHPNIVKNLSYGVTKDGQPYIVMEYLEGKTLADELKNGPLRLQRFRDVFIPLLSALEFAHQSGLVHRDIKPGNIVLLSEPDGTAQVKLVDFGIAKILASPEGSAQHLTKTGALLGSPSYMSPEQCIGKEVDARSDIYSIACVMYEALTGEPLFSGNTSLEVMGKHQREAAPTVAELSRKIDLNADILQLLLSALSKDPTQRPQTAQKFSEELSRCLDETTLSRVPRMKGPSQKGIPRLYLVLAAILAIVLLGDFYLISSRRSDDNKKAGALEMNPDTLIRRAKGQQDRGETAVALENFEKVIPRLQGKKSHETSLFACYFSAAMCCMTLAEEHATADGTPDPDKADKAIEYVEKAIEAANKTGSRSSCKEAFELKNHILAKRKETAMEVLKVIKVSDEHFEHQGTEYLEVREEAAHRLMEQGLWNAASALVNETAELCRKTYGRDSYQDIRAQIELAFLYAEQGKTAASNKIIEDKAPMIIVGDFGAGLLKLRYDLLRRRRVESLSSRIFPTLVKLKNPKLLEKLLALEANTNPEDFKHDRTFQSNAHQLLADAYVLDGNVDKALENYEVAFRILDRRNLPYNYSLLKSLVILYKSTHNTEKEKFYRRLLALAPSPDKKPPAANRSN